MTPNEHIGKMFSDMRRYRQMTQSELADKAGVAQARISELEAGSGNPSIETIVKIAAALRCVLDVNLTPQ